MSDRFKQKKLVLDSEASSGKIKVSALFSLLDEHPYQKQVAGAFVLEDIKDEIIVIAFIDTVYHRVKQLMTNNLRFNILAQSKDISVTQSAKPVEGLPDKPLVFHFNEYVEVDEVTTDLQCFAIYNAKNTFFDTYDMSKFANRLYKDGLGDLAYHNIQYFKDLAEKSASFNRHRSYRLVKNKGELFLRGITSIDRYFEYGVDFAFVISMLLLHLDMKQNPGNNYAIATAAVSESKLELIIAETHLKDAGEFGKVSSAMEITTNDLGEGSLNFTKIIRVGGRYHHGIYLFPPANEDRNNDLIISHSKKPATVLSNLEAIFELLNNTDEYIADLLAVKGIKKPEELRLRIVNKLTNPRSAFKDIHDLRDIFKTRINNEIASFAKLLAMCNKAEELDIDYDLKDKLRYLISDIILSGKK